MLNVIDTVCCPACLGMGDDYLPDGSTYVCRWCQGAKVLHLVARCGCGVLYTADDWRRLPVVGVQEVPDAPSLELRNCGCGSTLAVELPREAA